MICKFLSALALLATLGACTTAPVVTSQRPLPVEAGAAPDVKSPAPDAGIASSPWAVQSSPQAGKPSRWQHYPLLGKAATKFNYSRKDGRDAVAVTAQSSASMLRRVVRIEPMDLGSVRFSWKVPELIQGADLGQRDAADSPVRIVLAFEGDRSKFSPKNAMLSELAHALTGEPMPYATLMYVWCNQREPGTVIVSPRTDRIRKLVVESGARKLNQWLDYERNIRADFIKAFGESPGALVGVAIMTDTDNTHSTANAWYGPVRLAPTLAQASR
ncbi:MAG: DUF3047 domain-containing protein [Burkholderiaceae bacterium]|nr:DUF3047 domain-containing protein [Burkholderiaceae bacterium]MDO9089922.1 DUF3047 domain-containing protein [Burkholderiaceae bacterium]